MAANRIELKSKHCSGCLRTVDLAQTLGGGARCPVCGRRYGVTQRLAALFHEMRGEPSLAAVLSHRS